MRFWAGRTYETNGGGENENIQNFICRGKSIDRGLGKEENLNFSVY